MQLKLIAMKSSIRPLSIIMISLFGFFLIITNYADKSDFQYSGKEMLEIVRSGSYTVSLDTVKLNDEVIIDLRDSKQFSNNHFERAINIPLSDLLNTEYEDFFSSTSRKLLTSNDAADAHEAWMLLTQLGYKNLYVLD